jgi:hypothetical protein
MNPKVGSTDVLASQNVCVTVLLMALNTFVIPIHMNVLPRITLMLNLHLLITS